MRVLLVQSYLGGNEPVVFPIGLARIKSTLTGHDVQVFDTNTSSPPFENLKRITKDFQPELVGISLRNIDSTNKRKVVFYYGYLKEIINAVRSCGPVKIVVGGAGFSMCAQEIMEDEQGIDFGVYLEGEETFLNLLSNLDNPGAVKSVYYRRNSEIIFSGIYNRPDIKSLPAPDWSCVPLEDYTSTPESIGVETKRGCNLGCVYCIYGFLNGKAYRLRDPQKVVDEIEALEKKHGVNYFTFIDSIFNIPMDHAEAICREMINRKLKIKWSAWFNEEQFSKGFATLISAAGCSNVIFSPDGFSDATLQALGKNIKKKDILSAMKIAGENHGFEISCNYFKNPPGQSLGNFLSVLLFCVKSKILLKNRVHFEFNSIRIEPHTKLWEIAVKEGVIDKNLNLLFPVYYSNPKTWYLEKLFNFALRVKGK